jgi:hypothetical protein
MAAQVVASRAVLSSTELVRIQGILLRMASSGMLRREALVRTDVSEELSVRRLLVTANIPSSPILLILIMEALSFSEKSVLPKSHVA